MVDQTDNRAIPEIKPLDEFQEKFLSLPPDVQDWMCSLEAARNNEEIAVKFGASQDKNPIMAKLTGDIILKDIRIEALPELLQENLKINPQSARQIALEIGLKQLLIIRNHLPGVENFILQLGGTLPRVLPNLETKIPKHTLDVSAQIPTQVSTKKPFRLAIAENKEILNQLLTTEPIKIADMELPVRPTIKNWLSDYIKNLGTGHHEELERSEYLFKSANAHSLSAADRTKLAKILKAYDEDIEVPISPDTKLILIDELARKELPRPATPKPAFRPEPIQTPTPPPPPPAAPAQTPIPPRQTGVGRDSYRETVSQEDLAGPLKPLARPTPRIEGNIVDLKGSD